MILCNNHISKYQYHPSLTVRFPSTPQKEAVAGLWEQCTQLDDQ